ncbi:O-methyltransferase family 2 [Desulfofarcimen acetoxidans DSM 771]|uniref:O-methyltransferase family 2 n=1 Tax=Desulfofarcimen acetoxidans (strain ATCC 49208 / DSM 771 / KCTC 5769 / VKM B-1644 / 5575) TaxID=485916 RepID=C8W3C6_DESAS|nr:methyltransferase [Desulfofarcimen acetoxidans]ACV61893.1 O-methyltransferase family 2 [Desulfofarcimen acetoxidans DSM 771]
MNINNFEFPREFLIVGAAVKTGIFQALHKEALTPEQLAQKLKADPRAVWVVTESLLELGYLKQTDNVLKISNQANSMFYNPESPDYNGFAFMHTYDLFTPWLGLPDTIISGKPYPKEKKQGPPKNFIRAMSHIAQKSAPNVTAYCLEGLPRKSKILDIGGGPLTYAREFVKRGASVTILDLPAVIDMMQPDLLPGEPITMLKGDFNEGLPDGPFDLIYLGNVCHIYGEKENRRLFQRSAKALSAEGRIAIIDMIRGTNVHAALFAVNMLVNTENGGTWTFEQYKEWLTDAGFKVKPYSEISGRQIITGDKQ